MELLIIPGGTTSILQPLDVVVNKPFKDRLRLKYIHWLTKRCSEDNATTKGGYVRGPSTEDLIDWIKNGKEELSADLAIKAFKKTGVTCDVYRSELFEKLKINIDRLIKYLDNDNSNQDENNSNDSNIGIEEVPEYLSEFVCSLADAFNGDFIIEND